MPICGCYHICVDCFNHFFGDEEKRIACPSCSFACPKDLYVHASLRCSLLNSPEENKEYDKSFKKVEKIFNHSRNQLSSIEAYNKYLENKSDLCFKLHNKIDLLETEEYLDSFELNNRESIAHNAAQMVYDDFEDQQKHQKAAYIIEEFKRMSKIKLKKERLVDQYYRSYIDEKEFATKALELAWEGVPQINPQAQAQNFVTEIKETARSYAYTPAAGSKTNTQTEQASFQFPKPINPDMTLERARMLFNSRLDKMEHKNQLDFYHASKEAGGWSSKLVSSRYKECAFRCLFIEDGIYT